MRRKRRGWAERFLKKHRKEFVFLVLILLAGAAFLGGKRAAADRMAFPLDTGHWHISAGYGWRKDPFTGEKAFHNGIDLACAEGTAVLAAQDGIVTTAKWSDSYGNCVSLLHAGSAKTLYAHLQYIYAWPGETVAKGQPLGTAGASGRVTGNHLHFELWEKGTARDPAAALGLNDES